MPTTAGNLKTIIASFMGRDTVNDLTINSFDLGFYGLNAARKKVEKLVDFRYSEFKAALSIASTGTLLTAATGMDAGSSIKRVTAVELPIAAGDYQPIEFLTQDEWSDRWKRAIGRTPYSAAATAASLGITHGNPAAYQFGRTLYLVPASQFTFPVAARVDVIRFLPDYTDNANTDFFTEFGAEYLQWQAILEINKYFRRFVPKQESNIDEKGVEELAKEALNALIAWNSTIANATSTPDGDASAPPK